MERLHLHPRVEMHHACRVRGRDSRRLRRLAARGCNTASESHAAWLAPSVRRSLKGPMDRPDDEGANQ